MTPFYVPKEHLDREDELAEWRSSGFHDPIQLRNTNTHGYDGVLPQDA